VTSPARIALGALLASLTALLAPACTGPQPRSGPTWVGLGGDAPDVEEPVPEELAPGEATSPSGEQG
jgi:hypothetical protein